MVVVPDTEPPQQGRIVVGVCGTEASAVALRWAAEETRLRVALIICYAWQVHPSSVLDVLVPARAIPAQQQMARERVARWVAQILGPRQDEFEVSHGGPLEGLCEAAADADLLVLGRSAHSRLSRVLHGAVGVTSVASRRAR